MLRRYNNINLILIIFSIILLAIITYCKCADIDSPQCVYFNVEDCPKITETKKCKCGNIDKENVYCCDINGEFELREGLACAGLFLFCYFIFLIV